LEKVTTSRTEFYPPVVRPKVDEDRDTHAPEYFGIPWHLEPFSMPLFGGQAEVVLGGDLVLTIIDVNCFDGSLSTLESNQN